MPHDDFDACLNKIKIALEKKQYRMSVHCIERCLERDITVEQIEHAAFAGEVIEYYPEDKYGPSCLLLGYDFNNRPLHIQCSIEPVWIITCYDPSQRKSKWSRDFKKRIKS